MIHEYLNINVFKHEESDKTSADNATLREHVGENRQIHQ